MCMHTSLYVEESSARATGALRGLDSVTYQERVTKGGLFSLIKRASNVDVEMSFKQCYTGDTHHLFLRPRTGLKWHLSYAKDNLA